VRVWRVRFLDGLSVAVAVVGDVIPFFRERELGVDLLEESLGLVGERIASAVFQVVSALRGIGCVSCVSADCCGILISSS